LEAEKHLSTEEGTTQVGSVSPLLGNIFTMYLILGGGSVVDSTVRGFFTSSKPPQKSSCLEAISKPSGECFLSLLSKSA
jgi:hypothetical protein